MKENKSHFEILLDLAPAKKRLELEKIFRNNPAVEDESDPIFQFILVMGIYSDYMDKIPEKLSTIIEGFDNITKKRSYEILELSKINQKIANRTRVYSLLIFLTFIGMIFLFISQSYGVFNNKQQPTNKSKDLCSEPADLRLQLQTYEP